MASRPTGTMTACRQRLLAFIGEHWEELFFICALALLSLQVFFFSADTSTLADLHGAVSVFAALESFLISRLAYFLIPANLLPLTFLLVCKRRVGWSRCYLDILGIYTIFRLLIQLVGLNILVFDAVSSRFLLITQLLFFLPYSLLVWGWVYWRIDHGIQDPRDAHFKLDHSGDAPRPIDYFVAAFSSIFSASVNGIKGCSPCAEPLGLQKEGPIGAFTTIALPKSSPVSA